MQGALPYRSGSLREEDEVVWHDLISLLGLVVAVGRLVGAAVVVDSFGVVGANMLGVAVVVGRIEVDIVGVVDIDTVVGTVLVGIAVFGIVGIGIVVGLGMVGVVVA